MKNKQREELLRQIASSDNGYPVNGMWQRQTKTDPDIKVLFKKGLVKMDRTPTSGRKEHTKRQSYLTLTMKGLWALL